MYQKSPEVFDRDAEWDDLVRFVSSTASNATLGLVYGRRRQGKSLLLDSLAREAGGFYFEAGQTTSGQNLARFNEEWSDWLGHDAPLNYSTWQAAIEAALRHVGERPLPIVLDEFNYLIAADAGLASTIQRIFAPRSTVRTNSRGRLILCGSAFTVMAGLLSGTAPLRGRAQLELLLQPFDYLTAARLWGLDRRPQVAFEVYALLGGTPAYFDLCDRDTPSGVRDVPRWAARHLLNPASALHREGRVVVEEDPSIRDRLLAWSVLAAVVSGATSRSAIAAAVGREATALSRPLDLLGSIGLLVRDDDLLRRRRSRYVIGEPIVRAHRLLVAPHERRLARRQAAAVWDDCEHAVRSLIYRPAFEQVARDWLELTGPARAVPPTAVGWTEIACRDRKSVV